MDGGANVKGQYKGFSSWLTGESPIKYHIGCYAQVLNLVLTDITEVVMSNSSLIAK